MYSCVSGAVILLHITRQVLYTSAGLLASSCIHTRLLDRILGATISYFSATPSGAISSCFSADFSSIDRDIPSALASVVDAILGILVSVGVVIVASPFYILAVLPLIWMYMRVQSQYRSNCPLSPSSDVVYYLVGLYLRFLSEMMRLQKNLFILISLKPLMV